MDNLYNEFSFNLDYSISWFPFYPLNVKIPWNFQSELFLLVKISEGGVSATRLYKVTFISFAFFFQRFTSVSMMLHGIPDVLMIGWRKANLSTSIAWKW